MLECTAGKQGCPAKQKMMMPTDRGMLSTKRNDWLSGGSSHVGSMRAEATKVTAAASSAAVDISERYEKSRSGMKQRNVAQMHVTVTQSAELREGHRMLAFVPFMTMKVTSADQISNTVTTFINVAPLPPKASWARKAKSRALSATSFASVLLAASSNDEPIHFAVLCAMPVTTRRSRRTEYPVCLNAYGTLMTPTPMMMLMRLKMDSGSVSAPAKVSDWGN
mmetsp:Transcript_51010/g.143592  ORF Transcript_51010/g.143592 Transcript_51010/m.143592 type:complete len:222 (+) Transcript_51010:905-1570(+)